MAALMRGMMGHRLKPWRAMRGGRSGQKTLTKRDRRLAVRLRKVAEACRLMRQVGILCLHATHETAEELRIALRPHCAMPHCMRHGGGCGGDVGEHERRGGGASSRPHGRQGVAASVVWKRVTHAEARKGSGAECTSMCGGRGRPRRPCRWCAWGASTLRPMRPGAAAEPSCSGRPSSA